MAITLVLLAASARPPDAPVAAAAEPGGEAGTLYGSSQQEQQQQQQQQQQQPQQQQPQQRRYVIWSRIDQKTCLKAITAANLVPVVIKLLRRGDELVTDVGAITAAVQRLGPGSVAAVVTTTSCFAPRCVWVRTHRWYGSRAALPVAWLHATACLGAPRSDGLMLCTAVPTAPQGV
jgi:hypothetical protein